MVPHRLEQVVEVGEVAASCRQEPGVEVLAS